MFVDLFDNVPQNVPHYTFPYLFPTCDQLLRTTLPLISQQASFCYKQRRFSMGTLVFLILRFVFGFDFGGDAQTIATVISLDTIALVLFLTWRKK